MLIARPVNSIVRQANFARRVMRRIRYAVAASLDGYIAGPGGEADWIIMDPAIDFNSFFQQFDTVLLGRRTFDSMGRGGNTGMPGMKTLSFLGPCGRAIIRK